MRVSTAAPTRSAAAAIKIRRRRIRNFASPMMGSSPGALADITPVTLARYRVSTSTRLPAMSEPTFADVDALVGPATPHFAYQLRARVRELVMDLPEDHEVRKYADAKIALLDDLGHAS